MLDPEFKELWSPIGFTFIDEQLFRKPIIYLVDFEPTLERSRQWEILNTHPFFTGVCPSCGGQIPEQPIHWDCDSCGWKDDSLE